MVAGAENEYLAVENRYDSICEKESLFVGAGIPDSFVTGCRMTTPPRPFSDFIEGEGR